MGDTCGDGNVTPPRSGQRGRPQQYSAIAVETGLLLRLDFGRRWRQTEGMLASVMRLLGLHLPVPEHTTFSRRLIGAFLSTFRRRQSTAP